MCKYKRGDVVWASCIFSDRQGVKTRPVIILKSNADCEYFFLECCTLLPHHSSAKGIKILSGTPRFLECGFENDTFVSKTNVGWVKEKFIRVPPPSPPRKNPMGYCSFVDEIK